MRIGVLAVQGAFIEHIHMLQQLHVDCFEIRKKEDLTGPLDGLILPGGESTVMGNLLHELGLYEPINELLNNGLPVLGTCAGLILLASTLSNDSTVHFGTLPVTVKRNGYGRQLGSFKTVGHMKGIGSVPMTFIRAPYITEIRSDVSILSTIDDKIIAVQYQNQIGLSFHPELDQDHSIHTYFVKLVSSYCNTCTFSEGLSELPLQ